MKQTPIKMTLELYRVRKQEISEAYHQACALYTQKILTARENLKAQLETLRALLPPTIPMPIEKRRKKECYDIQRAIRSKLNSCDNMRGWDVANAEVKFNNQGDMLLLEVAIPKTQEQ